MAHAQGPRSFRGDMTKHFKELTATLWVKGLLWDLILCGAVASVLVLMIRHNPKIAPFEKLETGEIARTTIRIPETFHVEDIEATSNEKRRITSQVADIYDFDQKAIDAWVDHWRAGVRAMRNEGNALHSMSVSKGAELFSERLGVNVSDKEFAVLRKIGFTPDLEKSASFNFAPLWDQKIVENKSFGGAGNIQIVDLSSNQTILVDRRSLMDVITTEEAAARVGRAMQAKRSSQRILKVPGQKWPNDVKDVVLKIQRRMVSSNITFNKKETESRRSEALKGLSPVNERFVKGEVLVREGERVTPRSERVLKYLAAQGSHGSVDWKRVPVEMFFASLLMAGFYLYLRSQFPRLLRSRKNIWVMFGFSLASTAAFKLLLFFFSDVVGPSFPRVDPTFFVFLMPVAAPAMMLMLLVGKSLSLVFITLLSVILGVMFEQAGVYGVYVFTVSLVGSWMLVRCKTRQTIYQAGLAAAAAGGLAAMCLTMIWQGQMPQAGDFFRSYEPVVSRGSAIVALWAGVGGLLGGWLSAAIALALTPVLESVLGYTTDLKLLELARMDHPLLKELVMKAPGTYHHSIIVGSLAEAGAEAVGANALLVRVGSYYHDVGKIGRAEYFVENQSAGQNPHEHTKPHLSAKIIISHVKEGRLLAQSYNLGQSLIDFIEQHHGTSLVGYFYNKAKQEAAKPGSTMAPDEVREEDFRYPGPKPQTKEAAIMALADSCEAATRSLVEPTPARIQGMVKKIFNKALAEELLSESEITMSEIHIVERAFVRILLGIHHNRVQYPDQESGLPQAKQPLSLVKSGQ